MRYSLVVLEREWDEEGDCKVSLKISNCALISKRYDESRTLVLSYTPVQS